MLLDYEELKNKSFADDFANHEIINENVVERFDSSDQYLRILSEHHKQVRPPKLGWGLAAVNTMAAFLVLVSLAFLDLVSTANTISEEAIQTARVMIFFTSIILSFFFIKTFLAGIRGITENRHKKRIKALAIEQRDVFEGYFTEFVKKQILPSVIHSFLAGKLNNDPSEIVVETRSDNKKIPRQAILIAGLYGCQDEAVIINLLLMFADDYSELSLVNYDVIQRIASNRFSESRNGS